MCIRDREDQYAGEAVFSHLLDFVSELLFCPRTEHGAFVPELVSQECRNLQNAMQSVLDDKSAYCERQLLRAMCRGERYACGRLGEPEELDKIDVRTLWAHDKSVLASSRVELFYLGSKSVGEAEALLQPLGDGALDGGFYAESYRRLSERSAAWADARYVRGNRRNVCWNSTADYLLLYPCITADSAGGNLSTEEYAFGGGYVHRVGRFDLAIRGDYRAGQEYRQVDPRPHNVVSDFTIKLGVGMQFPQYVLGLDLQGRLYKQDQDIDFFYPPGASSSELYMTGLGSYYTRYSLNSESFNIGYDGKGCLLAAQLMPRHAKGWYARAAFESLTTERLNKSNNTVPITRLKTRQATLSAAYRSGRWSLRAGGGYELRRSIEMIADRTGHSVIVDEQAMYKNRIWHADAEATVEWRRGTVNYLSLIHI